MDRHPLTESQRAAIEWLRTSASALGEAPLPGCGSTWSRWTTLVGLGATDLARARLAEGHLDALAIVAELAGPHAARDSVWGVWTAEPAGVSAERHRGGWHLVGEKAWCSGADALDLAIVSATAADGPRLFVVEPAALHAVPGSWPAIGMEATASVTMQFDLEVDAASALGGPDAYVDRPGFWHGGAGVAACWFGGALGIAERLRLAASRDDDPALRAAWGRVKASLEGVAALLQRSATEIDERPDDVDAARRRAMRIRLVVENAARATLAETTTALGAGALTHDAEHARRVVDLEVYLRQLRPEGAAAAFGSQYVDERILW
jgi:alkylation response protein AidB-like acyl-CoA dehydrogenase